MNTIKEMFELAKETNAGVIKQIARDKEGLPLAAVIVTNGTEETQEILDAVEKIEKGWDS